MPLDARFVGIALGVTGGVYIGCVENMEVRTMIARQFLEAFVKISEVPLKIEGVQ